MSAVVAAEKRQAADRDRFRGLTTTMRQVDRELDRLKCLLDGVLDTVAAAHEDADCLYPRDVAAVDACLVAASGAIEDLRETLKDPAKALSEVAYGKAEVPEVPQAETPAHGGSGDGAHEPTDFRDKPNWRFHFAMMSAISRLQAARLLLDGPAHGDDNAQEVAIPAWEVIKGVLVDLGAIDDEFEMVLRQVPETAQA